MYLHSVEVLDNAYTTLKSCFVCRVSSSVTMVIDVTLRRISIVANT